MSDDPERDDQSNSDSDNDDDLSRFKERTVDDVIEGREAYENEDTLRALYEVRGWTQEEIADFYDVDQATISRAMNSVGIQTRETGESSQGIDSQTRYRVHRLRQYHGEAAD